MQDRVTELETALSLRSEEVEKLRKKTTNEVLKSVFLSLIRFFSL